MVVRPSYVLGGHAMEIVYSDENLKQYLETTVQIDPERLVLIDKYLIDACEIDIDSLSDFEGNVVVGGIMEHIEQAEIHSRDLVCSLPTIWQQGSLLLRCSHQIPISIQLEKVSIA